MRKLRSIAINVANDLWGISAEMLDVALSVDEMKRGWARKDFEKSLKIVTDKLTEWGLDSQEDFREQIIAIHAFKDILCLRDGSEAWNRPGQTVDDLYKAFQLEHQNLLKLLAHEEADLDQAKKFCLLLSQWSGAEVMAEHQRAQEERHPFRRYAG